MTLEKLLIALAFEHPALIPRNGNLPTSDPLHALDILQHLLDCINCRVLGQVIANVAVAKLWLVFKQQNKVVPSLAQVRHLPHGLLLLVGAGLGRQGVLDFA